MRVTFCCNATLASVESLNQGGSLFANLQTAVRNMILIGVGVLQGLRTRRGAHLKGPLSSALVRVSGCSR